MVDFSTQERGKKRKKRGEGIRQPGDSNSAWLCSSQKRGDKRVNSRDYGEGGGGKKKKMNRLVVDQRRLAIDILLQGKKGRSEISRVGRGVGKRRGKKEGEGVHRKIRFTSNRSVIEHQQKKKGTRLNSTQRESCSVHKIGSLGREIKKKKKRKKDRRNGKSAACCRGSPFQERKE